MTQYPEAALARELGLCYAGLALVTDYDAGAGPSGREREAGPSGRERDAGPSGRERDGTEREAAVTMEAVFRVLAENIDRVKAVLLRAIPAIPVEAGCGCGQGAVDPGSFPA
jgi:5'-methylthioadenosine phosphorylase